MYLDESGVNRYIFREYGRGKRGKKVMGEVSGTRFVRKSIIAALSENHFFAPMTFEGTCETNLFNAWLREVLIPELQPGQVLILDNASFHKSLGTKRLIEESGCHLLFLPPYSPDLNPIEKCWANLKNKVKELLRKTKEFNQAFYSAILSM